MQARLGGGKFHTSGGRLRRPLVAARAQHPAAPGPQVPGPGPLLWGPTLPKAAAFQGAVTRVTVQELFFLLFSPPPCERCFQQIKESLAMPESLRG